MKMKDLDKFVELRRMMDLAVAASERTTRKCVELGDDLIAMRTARDAAIARAESAEKENAKQKKRLAWWCDRHEQMEKAAAEWRRRAEAAERDLARHDDPVTDLINENATERHARDEAEATVAQYRDDASRVMAEEGAPDELHCACVVHLRAEVARLRGVVAGAHYKLILPSHASAIKARYVLERALNETERALDPEAP